MTAGLHQVYLGLGTNLGERRDHLAAARHALAGPIAVEQCSSLYETPPWGVTDQPPFLNAVCRARTELEPLDLLRFLKTVEQQLGRVPSRRWGPRLIDLDILMYDDLVLDTSALTIPHRHMHERLFVLVPLAELAPDLRHPVLNLTMRELAAVLPPEPLERRDHHW